MVDQASMELTEIHLSWPRCSAAFSWFLELALLAHIPRVTAVFAFFAAKSLLELRPALASFVTSAFSRLSGCFRELSSQSDFGVVCGHHALH